MKLSVGPDPDYPYKNSDWVLSRESLEAFSEEKGKGVFEGETGRKGGRGLQSGC